MGDEAKRCYEFGPFRIDTAQRLLMRGEEVVPLTPKAVDTLLALVVNSGRVVMQEDLIKIVWPDTIVELNGLARNISLLRKALGDQRRTSRYIETISKRGYRFIAAVKESAMAASAVRSLVVLPFESRSSRQDYFAAGMTDALLTRLTKIGALKVVSYSGDANDAHEAAVTARNLNVDAALEGSVVASGQRVRITARLVRAGSGDHLWAEEYDGDMRHVLALQSEVARAVAREIQVKATPQEEIGLRQSRPVDPEAYQAYLKARYCAARRTGDDLHQSLEHFQRAIDKDPSYALAYAGMADVYLLLGSTGYDAMPPLEAKAKAEKLATQALALDDSLAQAHNSLAYIKLFCEWDFPAAEKGFRHVIRLDPGYSTGHQWYAHYFMVTGRLDAALQEMKRAQELDPLSLAINTGVGWCLYCSGEYERAIEQFRKVLELDANFVLARLELGMGYLKTASPGKAIAEWKKAIRASGSQIVAVLAGTAAGYANAGNHREAQKALRELEAQAATRYVPAVYLAIVHSALHQDEAALEWAQKALEERSHYLAYLKVEPFFERLRNNSKFRRLAHKHGLDP